MILASTQIYGSHGGIPSYMRRLSEILSRFGDKYARPLSAVSLLDREWDPARHTQPVRYLAFRGCQGGRARFVSDLARTAARQRGQTLILGHVALAPLGYVLRASKLIRSYVVVLHGIEAWRRLRSSERLACQHALAITATTRFTQEIFSEKNGIAPERISVIPLAIERSELERPHFEERSAGEALEVLFVGRLWAQERYKGADELIEAVRLLKNEKIRVNLNFVGTGDDVPRLEEKVKAFSLESCVRFQGSVSDEALWAAYRNCDVFALPSSGEGFGIAFLEAMSYGRPCLGARCGGVPEVIEDGVDGFLVSPGQSVEIAQCLRRFVAEPRLIQEMGLRGYRKVSQQFLLGNMMANWEQLLTAAACC
jgi:glycosyltransferase involved in cell wall biosynthesis